MQQQVSEASSVPSPGGERAESLIAVIWAHLCDRHVWPTWAEVDQQLYLAGTRFEDAREELAPGLVCGIDSRGRMLPSPEQRLRLTITGVANCQGGGDHVRTFMLLVQHAVLLERGWDYTSGDQPSLSFNEAQRLVAAHPGTHGLMVLRQVLSVIDLEPWCGGYSGDGDGRKLFVTRSVREFVGAKTFPAYCEVLDRLTRPAEVRVPAPVVPVVGSVQGSVDAVAEGLRLEIHPLLHDALWSYENGRLVDAADTALREVEARLVTLSAGASGLPEGESFGQRRVAAALKPSLGPILNVSHADDGYDSGEQDGMTFFFMGVYSGLRNMIVHRKFRPTDATEVAEILAVASMCMRRLDTAESRLSSYR
ncbi:TIGR02391 family protein [Micromonospora coerulea]|uniref:TIGR02391 family protein n=1 Tax=Micromonospora coerulea TaxID=47856 RepID=UPI0019050C1E|nr:TIGR02391 family protein [Micromonospora veneta]